MKKGFKKKFTFFPDTYILPSELHELKSQLNKYRNNWYIIKPQASCQGRGIFLTKTYDQIDPNEKYVAQKYITKPLLIDGLKFDLRIYVLLAGTDPLKVFVYEDGLVRLCCERYKPPTKCNI